MPDGTTFVRRAVLNRYNDDKGAIEQRIHSLQEQREKIDREIESLQSHLEDFLDPREKSIEQVVAMYWKEGIDVRSHDQQHTWLFDHLDDHEQVRRAWTLINMERDDWGN